MITFIFKLSLNLTVDLTDSTFGVFINDVILILGQTYEAACVHLREHSQVSKEDILYNGLERFSNGEILQHRHTIF